MTEQILKVEDLHVCFPTRYGENMVVDGIDFSVDKGEIIGIVGESGCGKSMTALSVMGLIASPGRIAGGSIQLEGEELRKKTEKQMQKEIRGKKISMIFQDPMTSLNPLITVGEQIEEMLRIHKKMDKKEAREQAIGMLKAVGIPMPERRYLDYPHALSGGMRQRIMIAMALCCQPKLLIADEPTTALDVTIQAQILELMREMREKTGTAIILITHDLGVVANICDKVAVMYCGKIVEKGKTKEILQSPQHPYTKGLIKSIPLLKNSGRELYNIPGTVPKMAGNIVGCKFHDRCGKCIEKCAETSPEMKMITESHGVCCHLCKEKIDG